MSQADSTAYGSAKVNATAVLAARVLRNELLAQECWLTGPQVAELTGGGKLKSESYEYASRLRREQKLFGTRFRGSYRYQAFRFVSETGETHEGLAELIALLPTSHDGWSAAFWLFQPTGRLGGSRPADIFAQDPDAVIDAARRDFEGDDSDW